MVALQRFMGWRPYRQPIYIYIYIMYAQVWVALQRFLGVAPMVMDGLDLLEKKSSNRPGIHYLQVSIAR